MNGVEKHMDLHVFVEQVVNTFDKWENAIIGEK